jgi:23S rRNA pseudouridine1911/1915/1917 synthase
MTVKEITILYEDENLLAVNKPSGLVVHADGRTKEEALTDWIKEKYPACEKVGEPLKIGTGETIKRWGIVHRIDRETSGVVLIAKNQKTYDFLKNQFLDREIEKSYHAVVYGDVRYDEGIINLPIGRNSSDFRKRATGKAIRGEAREAITHYKTLARKERLSLIEANPRTGRTHQLRVHFADIGHGIIGDRLYGVSKKLPVNISRLALHAYAIEFELPPVASQKKGELIKIIAPYSEDFARLVNFFKVA